MPNQQMTDTVFTQILNEFHELLKKHDAVGILKSEDKIPGEIICPKDSYIEFFEAINTAIEEGSDAECEIRSAAQWDNGYQIELVVGLKQDRDTWPCKYTLYFANKY